MKKENNYVTELEDLNEIIPLQKMKETDTQDALSGDIYKNNIDALRKHDPELLDIIETATIDEATIRVLYSESGQPRIVYKREEGKDINIHSMDDPVACANKAIDLLGNIEKEGIIVLFGFGLGYFAEELSDKFEKGHILLIYEAIPDVFKLALTIKDFSKLLESEKVKIVLGKDADNYSVIHSHHHLIMNGKFWVVKHEPSVKLNPEAYDNFFKRLNEEKSLSDMGVATTIRRGREFMDACFLNLHSIIRKPGVCGLKDIFKGCTAIVVSAGPSLDKNVHILKQAKGKAVIIATGGALPTLLACEILPDLVVEIDPVSDNIEDKFQENPELKNVPFICLAQYTPELINIYPGPLFINSGLGNLAFIWLKNWWEDKGNIECFGGSVAHLAFATAEYIGADVIALVGQDLSYKSDRMHTLGYSDDLDRRLENGKGKHDNILGGIPVRDIFGEEARSISQFLAFKISFENRMRGSNKKFVNATEGGLPIDGAINMRLLDFIKEYCNDEKKIDTFLILSGLANGTANYNLDGLIEEVTLARKKFAGIKRASQQLLKYIKRAKILKEDKNEDSADLNTVLAKVQKLIDKVKHPALNLLVGYNYGLELYLKKQAIQDIDDIEDKWEMLDKQLDRGQIYYSEIVKTINRFNKQLDKVFTALQCEKKVDDILADKSIQENERFKRVGFIYKETGILAQAAKYLKLALDGLHGNNTRRYGNVDLKLYLALAETYISQFRFYDADDIFRKMKTQALNCKEDTTRVMEKVEIMSKKCESKIRAWEAKKNEVSKILQKAEADYGSHLESGYFYFRIKDLERAEKAYMKAIETIETGVNSQELGAAYYGLAHTYLAMGDPEKAVEVLGKALEADSSNPVLYRDLGLIAAESNNIKPAEIFLLKAIELAPHEAELYKPLADLYMSIGETEKAVGLYEKALQANAHTPAIQHDLALTYSTIIGHPETR